MDNGYERNLPSKSCRLLLIKKGFLPEKEKKVKID
jgi:hypothetical protein